MSDRKFGVRRYRKITQSSGERLDTSNGNNQLKSIVIELEKVFTALTSDDSNKESQDER